MTNYFGVLVKILDDVVCLKRLVGGKQLHIDYRPETISVENAEYLMNQVTALELL